MSQNDITKRRINKACFYMQDVKKVALDNVPLRNGPCSQNL